MLIFRINSESHPRAKYEAMVELTERQQLSVIPLKDKKPLIPEWKSLQESPPTRAMLAGWFRQWPDADYGVLTGRHFVVVDIDTSAALEFCKQHLPNTPMRQITPRGQHWFYSRDGVVEFNSVGKGLDVRGEGGYIVIQPSENYRLIWDNTSCAPNFDFLPTLTEEHSRAIKAFRKEGAVTARSGLVAVGERNSTLTKWVGGMVADGLRGESLLQKARKANQGFELPLSDSEIRSVVSSIEHRELAKTETALNNRGYSFEELVAEELPEPRWLVDGILPEGSIILVGPPKSGKSALLEYLVTTIPGPVLYFALEYNKLMLQRRMKKLSDWGIHGGDVRYFDRDCALDAGMSEFNFIHAISTEQKPKLIIVDTLAKVKPDNDGSYDNEYKACDKLIQLANEAGANLLVVHHSRKQAKDMPESFVDQVLGSTAISASFDNVVGYRRDGDCACIKGQGRLIDDFESDLNYDQGRFTIEDIHEKTSRILEKEVPSASRLVPYLEERPRTSRELHELVNNDEKYSQEVSRSQISNELNTLVRRGIVNSPLKRGGEFNLVKL